MNDVKKRLLVKEIVTESCVKCTQDRCPWRQNVVKFLTDKICPISPRELKEKQLRCIREL